MAFLLLPKSATYFASVFTAFSNTISSKLCPLVAIIIKVFLRIGSSSKAVLKEPFTIFSASGNLYLFAKSFLSSTIQTLKPLDLANGAMALPTWPPPAISIAGSVVIPSINN